MITTVIKGVDDEIEFKGFKGRYFYMLAISIISLILLTFLLYIIGFSSILLIIVSFGIGVGIFFYLRDLMEKQGKWGHLHNKHKVLKPDYILIDRPFYKLLTHENKKNK